MTRTEKRRIRIRKHRIRLTALLLCLALVFGLMLPGGADASALKEEVVYVRLANDGSVEAVYVVNSFELGDDREILDYGNYAYVQNLTGRDNLKLTDGTVKITSGGDRLYYEGYLQDPQLPWLISISYTLDGKSIAPEALAGKSGRLAIHIETSHNPLGSKDFFDSFALQLALSLSSEHTRDIQAEGATIASAGEYRQINFVALPGSNASLNVYADVALFEMPAITIAGVRLNMDFDFDDVDLSDIRKLTDGIAELDDGVQELKDGVFELKDGVFELFDGTVELFDGTIELRDGIKELSEGTRDLKKGVKKASDGAKQLKSNGPALAGGVDQYFDVLLAMTNAQLVAGGLPAVTRADYKTVLENVLYGPALAAAKSAIETAVYGAAKQQILDAILESGIPEYGIPGMPQAAYDALDPSDPVDAALKGAIDAAVDAAFTAQKPMLDATVDAQLELQTDTIRKAVESDPAAKPLLDILEMLSGYDKMNTGVAAYTKGVARMSNGLVELYDGVDEMHDGVLELYDGTKELADGVEELKDGVEEMKDGVTDMNDGVVELSDGTKEMREETATLDRDILDGIKKEFDKMMGKGKKILSFVSGKNGEVSAVQFVMQTEGIKLPEKDVTSDWEVPELSFWDRLVALFKRS